MSKANSGCLGAMAGGVVGVLSCWLLIYLSPDAHHSEIGLAYSFGTILFGGGGALIGAVGGLVWSLVRGEPSG